MDVFIGLDVGTSKEVALAWGSASTSNVRFSAAAREAARFTAEVVLPTPPFWLAMAMTRAIGWAESTP